MQQSSRKPYLGYGLTALACAFVVNYAILSITGKPWLYCILRYPAWGIYNGLLSFFMLGGVALMLICLALGRFMRAVQCVIFVTVVAALPQWSSLFFKMGGRCDG